MKQVLILSLLASTLMASFLAYAGDTGIGKTKAAGCAACHGSEGISGNPEWPNLAGQKEKYLVSQLKAFRDGRRNNALMTPMAKPLSDDDITNISAYYASLK